MRKGKLQVADLRFKSSLAVCVPNHNIAIAHELSPTHTHTLTHRFDLSPETWVLVLPLSLSHWDLNDEPQLIASW